MPRRLFTFSSTALFTGLLMALCLTAPASNAYNATVLSTSYPQQQIWPHQYPSSQQRWPNTQQRRPQAPVRMKKPKVPRGTVPADISLILSQTFDYHSNIPTLVDVRQLKESCDHRDCIQSIDQPQFQSIMNTDFLEDSDQLILVQYNKIIRAYPHKILNGRELVNDQYGTTPVAVSYCPLSGSGTAFIATVNGLTSQFGISGLLHNSARVLYDRRTNNLWEQVTGEGIIGSEAGNHLQTLPSKTLSWKALKKHYPNAQVLQPEGQDRQQMADMSDRFSSYRRTKRIYFPVAVKDKTMHPKQIVYGLNINGHAAAISEKELRRKKRVRHTLDETPIEVRLNPDGSVSAVDLNRQQLITVTRLYWFAWYSFHSNTEMIL